MARNVTMADTGCWGGCRYLLHDRDAKSCTAFDRIVEAAGIQVVKWPPRSPNRDVGFQRCWRFRAVTSWLLEGH